VPESSSSAHGGSHEPLVTGAFISLLETVVVGDTGVEALELVVEQCVPALGVSAAAIVVTGPDGTLQIASASPEPVRQLTLFEVQHGEGPSVDCCRTGRVVTNADLTMPSPWRRYAPTAVDAGFRSVTSVPLRHKDRSLGCLTVLARAVGGIVTTANLQGFADVASLALVLDRAEAGALDLQQAFSSRIALEQAKGVIGERAGLHVEEAFKVLRTYARNRNLKLNDVAHAVVNGDEAVNAELAAAARDAAQEMPAPDPDATAESPSTSEAVARRRRSVTDADECLACGGPIVRTGHVQGTPAEPELVPVGFCSRCETLQARRSGVWLPLGGASGSARRPTGRD
jgi:hypothetical protein